MKNEAQRVELTVSCHDADDIPKVSDAGTVRKTPDGSVQVMHNGVLVAEGCYYGDWMTTIIRTLRGHHEPQEERVFHEIVERLATDTVAPTMVELGAFWGYYSLWMLDRFPAARAILVEPDPNNLEVGRRNLALNRRRAELVQAAVGVAAAPPQHFRCESDGEIRAVPTESVLSLLQRFEIPRIDVLLCDVQGAEVELLEGARDLLAERVRFLIVSTHHHLISSDPLTHQRCLDVLRDAGAHVIAEHTVAESFSGDGLVAVSFDPRDVDLAVQLSVARAADSLFGDPLDELAEAQRARQDLQAQLEVTAKELAQVRVAATSTEARAATEVAHARAEVAAMSATTTWQVHRRIERSVLGRALLRSAGRGHRSLAARRARAADG